jgi:hypothetical protein
LIAAAAALVSLSILPAPCGAASCLTAEPLFDLQKGGGVALRQPSDLSIHDDNLFVLDDLNGRVVRYSLAGEFLSSIPLPGGSGESYLGFDIGGDDNLYLAASEAGKVIVLSPSGRLVREFATGEKGGSSEPVAVALSQGSCFVIDNEEHKVKVFDLEGTPLEEWGGRGESGETFRYPFRIAVDSLGRIAVSDSLNSRVKVFTPKGEPLLDFGDFGVTEGTLFRPAGLEVWEGWLMVADNYLGAVQLFDFKGEYRAVLCGGDGAPLLFDNPVSLARYGPLLFVLEMGAGRVRALKVEEP